jgi:hypothetical protein
MLNRALPKGRGIIPQKKKSQKMEKEKENATN